jgi:hypothetical protein
VQALAKALVRGNCPFDQGDSQKVRSRAEAPDRIAFRFEQHRKGVAHRLVVIDDIHTPAQEASAAPSRLAMGKVTRNTVRRRGIEKAGVHRVTLRTPPERTPAGGVGSRCKRSRNRVRLSGRCWEHRSLTHQAPGPGRSAAVEDHSNSFISRAASVFTCARGERPGVSAARVQEAGRASPRSRPAR